MIQELKLTTPYLPKPLELECLANVGVSIRRHSRTLGNQSERWRMSRFEWHMEIISSGMHLRNPREMLIFPSDCGFWAEELGGLAFFPDLLSQTGFRSDFSIPALAGQHNEWRPLQKRLFHFIKLRSHKLGGYRISNLSTFTAV